MTVTKMSWGMRTQRMRRRSWTKLLRRMSMKRM